MKLSINWLKEFVDIADLSVEEIIDKATNAGFEIEDVEYRGNASGLIVGKVIECADHPDSDHLHITKVDIGEKVLDIVCGAPNCRRGLKVIVAKVGAVLPELVIKAGKIRGAVSDGMLCSLLELGVKKELLADDSPSLNGIEELDDSFVIGDTDILERLGYKDVILDVSIYANRPDCLSMFAMAKEMAAILDRECRLPEFAGYSDFGQPTTFQLTSQSENCPHFLAKVVNKVVIKPSPKWMRDHLLANGVKSINNVIDISNYVMLETGQPMHFYDLRTNPKREIEVIDDYEGEYEALDGIIYPIEKGDLMITSDQKPIGIAGIMGGENTKILDDTSGIIIECALFDHARIRRTANRLGLQTEAAMRFAKGLDPLAQKKAMDRSCQLLQLLADADGFEATVEYGSDNYTPYEVRESAGHLSALIGKEFTTDDLYRVLKRLDFEPRIEGDEVVAKIPSYRSMDIKLREDIDEEVVRLTGFADLEATLPIMPSTIGQLSPIQKMRRAIRSFLMYSGLNETCTYTLVRDEYVKASPLCIGEPITLLSPLSDVRRCIRTSLIDSMMETLAYNEAHYNENVNLFELSSLYAKDNVHKEHLAILLSGSLQESKVIGNVLPSDFYTLKGLVMALLDRLGFEKGRISIKANDLDSEHFNPYQSCLLLMDNQILGILGKIHPRYAQSFKTSEAAYCELDLSILCEAKAKKIKAPEVNRYPTISRDISVVVKEEVEAFDLLRTIKKAGGRLVKDANVFDIYRGHGIEEGYKSVTVNIIYESSEKTLKIEDIMPLHDKILDELNKNYQANLRN